MKIFELKNLRSSQLKKILQRPNNNTQLIQKTVREIVSSVKKNGLAAALKYARQLDGLTTNKIFVEPKEFDEAEVKINKDEKAAFETAYENIYKFHSKQFPKEIKVETKSGVKCERRYLPIENVGLYIPGGSAVLPSTILMLGIPAKIAGCKRIVVSSPAKNNKINHYLLYAAKLCGITDIIKIGGAQGIALMAYGDKNFEKVNKIFGPGNRYVTYAKMLVSTDYDGAAIDMAAGPSEVLIIADKNANAEFVASDLISQAEHGADSQVILLTTSKILANKVVDEISKQIKILERKTIIKSSLKNARIIVTKNIDESIEISNYYAPEHLILNCENYNEYVSKVKNAGSVFLGEYSPESAGDYSSGTNHSLPTYGLAKSIGGITVEMFMKSVSFQELTKSGLKNISQSIITLATVEKLQGHANAVKVRLK